LSTGNLALSGNERPAGWPGGRVSRGDYPASAVQRFTAVRLSVDNVLSKEISPVDTKVPDM
jgi:hypothetical protein